jgi:beta-galactosidase
VIFFGLLLVTGRASGSENFEADWRFFKGNADGAQEYQFDDSGWRNLSVPHDWSIEGPFSNTNATRGAGGFLPSGVAWYRKHFSLSQNDSAKVFSIQFDGVMANSDVWINGVHLGHRPFGYVSFRHALTGHLKFGGDNVLAVRCDTSAQPASRWYSGAGIYRHVRLVQSDTIHFEHHGIFVRTPQASSKVATVSVETVATNETSGACKLSLTTQLISPEGRALAQVRLEGSVAAGATTKFSPGFKFTQPRLWDLDSPHLYRTVSELSSDGKVLDRATNTFGIRDARFEAATGFSLNGKNFKLKGVCLHHDGGAFGAAVPRATWEERLKTLKSLGVNAIRTAHNPPAPELLDACDRLGFLVMDEFFDCWTVGKTPFDYHLYFKEWSQTDERDTIRRDRNHPSIVLYSVGNEIHDTPKADLARRILTGLVAVCHEEDPTRPVTQALFRPNVSGDYTNGLAELLDVVGTNYRDNELLAVQREHPAWKIIGTEQRHDRQTWLWLRDSPSHSGQFLWTGVDYLGESRSWPLVGSAAGLLDRTGRIKPMALERASWWSEKPFVRIVRRVARDDLMPTDPGYGGPELHRQVQFADWTPRNSQPHDENVEVYSNCKEVELYVNGKSVGAKPINADASPRTWIVPLVPGSIQAVARDAMGKTAVMDELRTAGPPAKIILTTETRKLAPGFENVATVRAKIADKDGIEIPTANDLVSFEISGPGEIAAVDNGANASQEPFQTPTRHAFRGECVAFIRTTAQSGNIVLKATAPDLKGDSIELAVAPEGR